MDTNHSLYNVPEYVRKYCKGRLTEVVEYLTEKQYSIYLRKYQHGEIKRLEVLGSEKDSQYIRCLVTRQVLPLTVMKNPMLKRAAELEYKTYNGEFPISLQEARWILVDEYGDKYPDLNSINQPTSCLVLIQHRRGQFKLCLNDTVRIANERRSRLCIV